MQGNVRQGFEMADAQSDMRGEIPYHRFGIVGRVIYLSLALVYSVFCLIPSRRGRIVLCYHSVIDSQSQRFKKQLQFLKGTVFPVNKMAETKSGVFVTFDDAFACLLQNVIPLAEQYNIPIAIFPVTENANQPPRWDIAKNHPEARLRTMSETELSTLRGNPIVTIGSHTATHPRLGNIPAETVKRELQSSRESLAALFGFLPCDLALPHGSYNTSVIEFARDIGYTRVYTIEPDVNTTLSPDGRIGRFQVDPDMWMIEFKLTAIGAYGYLRPLRSMLDSLRK